MGLSLDKDNADCSAALQKKLIDYFKCMEHMPGPSKVHYTAVHHKDTRTSKHDTILN